MLRRRTKLRTTARTPRPRRAGVALLLCLFVVSIVSSLLLNVLNTQMLHLASARSIYDYERALYLANAGIHHACAELAEDAAWRGTIVDGAYPANDTYTASAQDGPPGTIEITATGVAGEVARTIVAHVEL